MKKETLIAIVFGIVLGGSVALFILLKGEDFGLGKSKVISPKQAAQEGLGTPVDQSVQSLEITAPTDGAIVDSNSIKITGKAAKDGLLVIQSPIKDISMKLDKSEFSVEFPLALGENIVKIVSYPSDNTLRPQERNLKIYYLDSEL